MVTIESIKEQLQLDGKTVSTKGLSLLLQSYKYQKERLAELEFELTTLKLKLRSCIKEGAVTDNSLKYMTMPGVQVEVAPHTLRRLADEVVCFRTVVRGMKDE